jgi:hypothetical protein
LIDVEVLESRRGQHRLLDPGELEGVGNGVEIWRFALDTTGLSVEMAVEGVCRLLESMK